MEHACRIYQDIPNAVFEMDYEFNGLGGHFAEHTRAEVKEAFGDSVVEKKVDQAIS